MIAQEITNSLQRICVTEREISMIRHYQNAVMFNPTTIMAEHNVFSRQLLMILMDLLVIMQNH